ncbi:hypothetical protein Curi_c20670 [Gottschalkia acidurici 9a]|uniref:Uncharacterized protein n=1 Tax=Gottschalkia acidurici (strain ATCC 7906 / DSM 604 / BCRC 14475 / CIP 104303 / KCTC 5404 / NCIMB 10678 / 9a) TaxID=1128398 RepID=K0B358_GOTA9|nr:hypothetical protein Curi_c20670 [Gottschalkia acidurici 9a]
MEVKEIRFSKDKVYPYCKCEVFFAYSYKGTKAVYIFNLYFQWSYNPHTMYNKNIN